VGEGKDSRLLVKEVVSAGARGPSGGGGKEKQDRRNGKKKEKGKKKKNRIFSREEKREIFKPLVPGFPCEESRGGKTQKEGKGLSSQGERGGRGMGSISIYIHMRGKERLATNSLQEVG